MTFEYVLTRQGSELPRSLATLGNEVRTEKEAWSSIRVQPILPLNQLELALDSTSEDSSPALVAYVEDSDYAYIAGFESKRDPWRLLFNPHHADHYAEGQWALRACSQLSRHPRNWPEVAAERASAWSKVAPKRAPVSNVRALLDREWLFAEEAIDEMLELVGLSIPRSDEDSGLTGAAYVPGGKVYHQGRMIDTSEQRFVVAYGEDYIGIWDRRSGGAPLTRHPKTAEGYRAAMEEWFSRIRPH